MGPIGPMSIRRLYRIRRAVMAEPFNEAGAVQVPPPQGAIPFEHNGNSYAVWDNGAYHGLLRLNGAQWIEADNELQIGNPDEGLLNAYNDAINNHVY